MNVKTICIREAVDAAIGNVRLIGVGRGIEDHGIMPLGTEAITLSISRCEIIIIRTKVYKEAFIPDIDNKGSHIAVSVIHVVPCKMDRAV